jgi:hypothetical protein
VSHPLCDYARHVQRTLGQDEALERPAYTWCLQQATAHMDAAVRTISPGLIGKARRAAIGEALVIAIKPEARRVKR